MHITFTQPAPYFSTPLRLLSKLLRFRTLWAYSFDSAAQRALEKSKVGEVNLEVSSQLEFSLKINCGLRI